MGVTRFGRRLFHDTSGQVLLFGAILVVAILAFLLAIPNGTQVTAQKVRAQTAADVGAFTGSVWLARALNLNANMNIGIRSVYTWSTVLTMGSALAQALFKNPYPQDGVKEMGQALVTALFGTSAAPPAVSNVEYPNAIQSLNTTAHWLVSLQDDIVASFHDVAATLGTEEASRNAGAYPPSPTAGGWVLVRSNDTLDSTPLLVETDAGDSLMYHDLRQLADGLETIPSGNPNIGPAIGEIVVDPDSLEIYAYYGFDSQWWDVFQGFHYYMDYIAQYFQWKFGSLTDTGRRFFEMPGGPIWVAYLQGDSWVSPFRSDSWIMIPDGKGHPGDNKYKIDTCWWVGHRVPKWQDTGAWYRGDSTLPHDPDWEWDSTRLRSDLYAGADSTVGHPFDKVSPRRVNPDRWFHAVSYVWRQGASTSPGPYGLGAPMGGSLFPRSKVAAQSPLFTVARSVPYMAIASPTEYEYYFTPGWDARLTPLDAVGVSEIAGDTAFDTHSRGSFDNLEDLRKYVLLP